MRKNDTATIEITGSKADLIALYTMVIEAKDHDCSSLSIEHDTEVMINLEFGDFCRWQEEFAEAKERRDILDELELALCRVLRFSIEPRRRSSPPNMDKLIQQEAAREVANRLKWFHEWVECQKHSISFLRSVGVSDPNDIDRARLNAAAKRLEKFIKIHDEMGDDAVEHFWESYLCAEHLKRARRSSPQLAAVPEPNPNHLES